MHRTIAFVCMLVLLAGAGADARGGRGGGGMSRPAPSRPAPSRPAQMPSRPATPPSGFSGFNGDFSNRAPVNPSGQRPSQPIAKPPVANRPPVLSRPPGSRPPIPPPVPPRPPWGWNGGVVWYPAPYYYGGGFWGAYAVGLTTAVVLGSVDNEETKEEIKSYQVAPDSPGAKVLQAYKLQQVECKSEGVVVIYGPENSVVCATPNDIVAAGTYDLNVDDLTIYSRK